MRSNTSRQALKYANEFINFVNESPTPYHVVQNAKDLLMGAGFKELSERQSWTQELANSGKYFVTRNGSSIIAFTVGANWKPGNGISMIGAHTDSPVLRIKPVSKSVKEGYHQVGVEIYGGGIWHTWFDRDLSCAGRVFVNENGKFVSKLVKIDKPLLRIPTLAIHLTTDRYNKFEYNKEKNLKPIIATSNSTQDGCCSSEENKLSDEQFASVKTVIERHNVQLLDMIAAQLNCAVADIEDFELVLFDTQKSVIGGANDEFIFSPRLDNQVSCFCAVTGLINSAESLPNETGIQLISLFDHEEVGSMSAQGANSSFLPDILKRIATDEFAQTLSKSFIVSSDMAHGVHPNYPEFYESEMRPLLNGGPVIKINANQRYVTNSAGILLMKKIADKAKVPMQLFTVKNDSPCGSTIGPFLSAKLGVRTLDLGNPQLSMHSIRETGGAYDIEKLIYLFESFFEHYSQLEESILVDAVDQY